ncbi:MAG: sigma-70 family RNA polymerase sigma factor [Blastocatellia bacterium]
MVDASSHQITHLLAKWSEGDEYALEELMPLVYDELRRMARSYLRRRPGNTFQTTDLIHETYVKLAKNNEREWQNRAHFFGVAATAMRHILVDYARSKQSQKRGGWQERRSLRDDIAETCAESAQVVALDDALNGLAELDQRKSRVVELKYFGGLTNEETAELLKISVETVKRDWRFARTWLLRELDGTQNG